MEVWRSAQRSGHVVAKPSALDSTFDGRMDRIRKTKNLFVKTLNCLLLYFLQTMKLLQHLCASDKNVFEK